MTSKLPWIPQYLLNRRLQILREIPIQVDFLPESLPHSAVGVQELISVHRDPYDGDSEVDGLGEGQKTSVGDEEDTVGVSWR